MSEQQTAVAAAIEKSPRESAEEYVSSLNATEVVEPETKSESGSETKPDPKPETPPSKKETSAELNRIRAEKEKLHGMHESLNRRTEKVTHAESELKSRSEAFEAQQKEFDAAMDSPVAMVSYYAKRRGVSADDVWLDIAEQLRNNGKRTPESEIKRELDALKRELSETKKEKAEREAREKKEREQQEMIELQRKQEEGIKAFRETAITTVLENVDEYPTLATYPKTAIGTMVLDVADQWCEGVKREIGRYPNADEILPIENFLEFLEKRESEQSETRVAAKVVAPKQKPKVPTNSIAAGNTSERELSFEERKALVAKELAEGRI